MGLKQYFRWWGENQAAWSKGNTNNKPSATYVVDTLWMKSQGHKENMLRENYNYIGVGVAKSSDGWYYFVQEFAETKRGMTGPA